MVKETRHPRHGNSHPRYPRGIYSKFTHSPVALCSYECMYVCTIKYVFYALMNVRVSWYANYPTYTRHTYWNYSKVSYITYMYVSRQYPDAIYMWLLCAEIGKLKIFIIRNLLVFLLMVSVNTINRNYYHMFCIGFIHPIRNIPNPIPPENVFVGFDLNYKYYTIIYKKCIHFDSVQPKFYL